MTIMTVKELKDALNKFDDRLLVFSVDGYGYSPVSHVYQGVNVAEGFLFLDHYEENNDD